MKTAVITDSASYLDPEVAAKYNITVLPITVIFGNEQFRDGVDITSQEFLKKLAENEKLPTTAQVTMGQMQEAFDQLSA
ncbi:DegV family protein, partial [uncultured Lentilactobacillus sp.]